ncbi:hypothetical protein DFP72DRAFT_855214 [Ephemerocybe angulata]|uniref:Uncharacterized protein n=1 Tax=Ephemerocybe angulata TaxID=980116 RepID=A0A8H6HJ01_9AGAR|nr:hypothetical protein DFP72DRAFT_855214 [Tulosesus angulatus]
MLVYFRRILAGIVPVVRLGWNVRSHADGILLGTRIPWVHWGFQQKCGDLAIAGERHPGWTSNEPDISSLKIWNASMLKSIKLISVDVEVLSLPVKWTQLQSISLPLVERDLYDNEIGVAAREMLLTHEMARLLLQLAPLLSSLHVSIADEDRPMPAPHPVPSSFNTPCMRMACPFVPSRSDPDGGYDTFRTREVYTLYQQTNSAALSVGMACSAEKSAVLRNPRYDRCSVRPSAFNTSKVVGDHILLIYP